MTAEVRGEVETENRVLVIRRIHVRYHLIAAEEDRPTIERVHEMHAAHCPVYLSLRRAIDITTEVFIDGALSSSATAPEAN